MKWRNHKLVTFSAVYSMTGGIIAALAAMIGSVLPDLLELKGIIPHRTITHYLWFWLAGSIAIWLAFKNTAFSSISLYSYFFVISGGLLHVCEDALSNGGVPIYTPYGSKLGVGLYKTDTISEELVVLSLVVLFGAFAWFRGFLSVEHFGAQFKILTSIFRTPPR